MYLHLFLVRFRSVCSSRLFHWSLKFHGFLHAFEYSSCVFVLYCKRLFHCFHSSSVSSLVARIQSVPVLIRFIFSLHALQLEMFSSLYIVCFIPFSMHLLITFLTVIILIGIIVLITVVFRTWSIFSSSSELCVFGFLYIALHVVFCSFIFFFCALLYP